MGWEEIDSLVMYHLLPQRREKRPRHRVSGPLHHRKIGVAATYFNNLLHHEYSNDPSVHIFMCSNGYTFHACSPITIGRPEKACGIN